jgi:polyferredoxin
MLVATGHPCPTCGVTTSFVLAAHGRPVEAFANQPLGLVVFLGALGGLGFTLVTLMAGRTWSGLLNVFNVTTFVVIITVIALISWAYKWSTT